MPRQRNFYIEILHEHLTDKEEILFRFCCSMFIPSDLCLLKSTYKISNLQKPVIFLIRCTGIPPASKYLSKHIDVFMILKNSCTAL